MALGKRFGWLSGRSVPGLLPSLLGPSRPTGTPLATREMQIEIVNDDQEQRVGELDLLPLRPHPTGAEAESPIRDRIVPPLCAELLTGRPVRQVELRLMSPMFFARKGRDLPLPDPVLVVRSLATRWNIHAPTGLALPAEVVSALLDCVYLAGMAGETRRTQVSRAMWQTGFVGAVSLALTKAGDELTAQMFTALTHSGRGEAAAPRAASLRRTSHAELRHSRAVLL